MNALLRKPSRSGGLMFVAPALLLLAMSAGAAAPRASTCDWFHLDTYGACVPPTNCLPAQYVSASCLPHPGGMTMNARVGPVGSDVLASTVGTFFEMAFDGTLPCGMPAGTTVDVEYTVDAAHLGGTLVVNGAMLMCKVDDGAGNFNYLNGHMFPNHTLPSGSSYTGQFSSFPLAVGGAEGTWMMFVAFAYTPPEGGVSTLDLTLDPIRVTVNAPPPACPTDFNADGVTSTPDLVFFLGRFGEAATPGSPAARADFNGDGTVNTPDLITFLGRFGTTCP